MFKNKIKLVLFVLIFFMIYIYLPNIFEKHRDGKNWDYIYNTENKIDVLFMGSSLIFTSINPDIVDSIINQNSFILGSSGQNIIQSYYNLIEVLKYKKPHTIVLDVNSIIIKREDQKTGLIYHNLSGMKLSVNKINSFLNTIHANNNEKIDFSSMSFLKQYDFIITLLTKERFNWKNKIKGINSSKATTNNVFQNRGFKKKESKISFEDYNSLLSQRDDIKIRQIVKENFYFLEKFIDTCNYNNINLVLVKTPTLLNEGVGSQLDHYIDGNNISYYNYELDFDIINFDKDDFYDEKHLSNHGANKFSYFFGKSFLEL